MPEGVAMKTQKVRVKQLVANRVVGDSPSIIQRDIIAGDGAVYTVSTHYNPDDKSISLYVTSDVNVAVEAGETVASVAVEAGEALVNDADDNLRVTKFNIGDFVANYRGTAKGVYVGTHQEIYFIGNPRGNQARCRVGNVDFIISSAKDGKWIYLVAKMAGDQD